MQTATLARIDRSTAGITKTSTGHVVDHGIPIPPKWSIVDADKRGRPAVLDLSPLAVGDSVFLKAATKSTLVRARANARSAAKRANIKITTRSVEGGIRVWRAA